MGTTTSATTKAAGDAKTVTKTGVVESDKRNKTRKVVVRFMVKHPKYGKFVRRRTVFHVHDEGNESRTGDLVEIAPTRPVSKTKSWRLVRVVERGHAARLLVEARARRRAAALRGAQHLERDLAAQNGIEGLVHDAHAALPEAALDDEAADGAADEIDVRGPHVRRAREGAKHIVEAAEIVIEHGGSFTLRRPPRGGPRVRPGGLRG